MKKLFGLDPLEIEFSLQGKFDTEKFMKGQSGGCRLQGDPHFRAEARGELTQYPTGIEGTYNFTAPGPVQATGSISYGRMTLKCEANEPEVIVEGGQGSSLWLVGALEAAFGFDVSPALVVSVSTQPPGSDAPGVSAAINIAAQAGEREDVFQTSPAFLLTKDDFQKGFHKSYKVTGDAVQTGSYYSVTGTLTLRYKMSSELQADPGGPYTIERGQPVVLDGMRSTGKIVDYKWTFAPLDCPSNLTPNSQAVKKGKKVSVLLLCSVEATLAVSDGRASDSKTVRVTVTPRQWQTSFSHSPVEGYLGDGVGRPVILKGYDTGIVGGENVCARDPQANELHQFHPPASQGTWNKDGYDLQQVSDAGGPFDRHWYVSKYKLVVERKTLINKYLVPGGPPPLLGAKPFYLANKELGTDVDGYLAAIRAHEGMQNDQGVLGHSGRIQQALIKDDPARKIESLASEENEQALGTLVDAEIRKVETAICKATIDPLPRIWSGKTAFAHNDTGIYEILSSGISVGGVGYGNMAPCK